MSLTALGGTLIIEQVEVIREIARNLLGEAPPGETQPTASSVPDANAAWPARSAERPGLPDAAVAGSSSPASSGALSLLGIRLPAVAAAGSGVPEASEIRQLLQLLSGAGGTGSADAVAGSPEPSGRQAGAETSVFRLPEGRAAPSAAAAESAAAQDRSEGMARSRQPTGADALRNPEAGAPRATRDGRSPTRSEAPGQRAADAARADDRPAASASPAAQGNAQPVPQAVDAPSPQSAASADALAMLGLADRMTQIGSLGAERAGVLASFILNAHMLPGWPPPRPFARVAEGLRTAGREATPQLTRNEELILIYLLNLGLNANHLDYVLKTIRSARRRSSLFTAIANLLSSATNVVHIVEVELESLVDDLLQERKVRMRMLPSARLRTDLR